MLTAAVRDLHQCYPGKFLTDVRTPCQALWENNPNITSLADDDPDAQSIECHYPLIHQSNQRPYHFIHGFHQFLSGELDVKIEPTEFRGDIRISTLEKSWISQVAEICGQEIPFWVVSAGGKHDFTIKWWSTERFQSVVDSFKHRILFVQVGEKGHHHPPLRGVIDLRGKTDLRQLVRLVYHAQGILSPVSLLMHLAAAVETKPIALASRPCVVVAGGREPAHWEAYPSHQFIHTIGALPCCVSGGCWRSRTVKNGSGDSNDESHKLCLDVVGDLPRCMHMISAEEVSRRIQLFFEGGALQYLTPDQCKRVPIWNK